MFDKDLAPFVPTKFDVVTKMLKIVHVGSEDIVYDLGCEDGCVLIAAVKDFGAKKAVRYEVRNHIYEIAKQNIELIKIVIHKLAIKKIIIVI